MTIRDIQNIALTTKPGVVAYLSPKAVKSWNPDVSSVSNAKDERSISLFGPIGEWYGEGNSLKRVSGVLRNLGAGPVDVLINSPGGDFFEGLAIYNRLGEHDGEVTIKVLGMAASAASAIAMAGDQILVAKSGFLMIHNTRVLAGGDRHDLRAAADWLEPFDQALAEIYEAQSGVPVAKLKGMLDKETWISGASAVEQGFADEVLAAGQLQNSAQVTGDSKSASAQVKMDAVLASMNFSRNERRSLIAALKGSKPGAASGGMPSAVEHDTQDAVIEQGLMGLLAKLS